MKIAREKLEANMYSKKMQDMERIENEIFERLQNTQDHRKTLLDKYQSMISVLKAEENL